MYTSYQLTQKSKKYLTERFPPKYSKPIGHHVTYEFGVHSDTPLPPLADINVIGYQDNPDGIEALVVSVDGEKKRKDGSLFHITWSLDPNEFKPVHANDLVKRGNHKLIMPIKVYANPAISN